MRYLVNYADDEGDVLVTFPDIPEATTNGGNLEEARAAAQDALESALEFYFEDERPVPLPSKLRKKDEFVELPVSLSAKILLLNEMIHQKVRPADLARRLAVTRQEVNRLTDLNHSTKIDVIAAALKVLGKTLEVSTV